MTDFVCKKCGSTEYEIKDKSNGTGTAHGLYCAKCGFWHKWLGKEELRQYAKQDRKDEIIARLQTENAKLKYDKKVAEQALLDMCEEYEDNFECDLYKECDSAYPCYLCDYNDRLNKADRKLREGRNND